MGWKGKCVNSLWFDYSIAQQYPAFWKSLGDRILVYCIPGILRSTFAKKIAIDWARGKKKNLKKFDLQHMIPLRSVSYGKTLPNIRVQAVGEVCLVSPKNISEKKNWF